MARQAPTLAVDGYTLSDVQQAVAQQALARLQLSRSQVLLRSFDRLQRQYDAIVAIESLAHSPNVAATLRHWASQLRPGGIIVIIDELFRPEVPPAHPEIQQFVQFLHFSLLLQRPPVEAMVHAAGLSIAAWVVLSDSYLCIPGQTKSVTASRMRISSMVSTGDISGGCCWKSSIIEDGSIMSCSC